MEFHLGLERRGGREATRRGGTLLLGASVLALACPAPALAQQATPGSAQCPAVDGVVTCSGAIPQGLVVVDGDGVREVRIRALTAPIAPALNLSGVSVTRVTGPVTIVTEAGPNGITVNGAADAIRAQTSGDIAIDNALDLGASQPGGSTTPRAGTAAIRATVNARTDGGRSTVGIRNSGDIVSTVNGQNTTSSSGAIVADLFAATDLTIRNSGTIRYSAAGNFEAPAAISVLAGTSDPHTITIANSGDLILDRADAGISVIASLDDARVDRVDIDNSGAITGRAVRGISLKLSGIGTSVGEVRVVNHGSIAIDGQDDDSFATGIEIVQTSPNGALTPVALVNDGDIAVTSATGGGEMRGITLLATNGFVTLTNSGTLTAGVDILPDRAAGIDVAATGFDIVNRGDIGTRADFFFGSAAIFAGNLRAQSGPSYDGFSIDTPSRLENSGTLTARGSFNDGIELFTSSTLDMVNSGSIRVDGERATGISVYSLTRATVANTGAITAAGDFAHGVALYETSLQTDEDIAALGAGAAHDLMGRIDFTSNASITATGNGADGIRARTGRGDLQFFDDPEFAEQGCENSSGDFRILCAAGPQFLANYDGTIAVTIAGGTVSGGSGSGAGISLSGIGTHILDNNGTITALSGRAVVGETGRDTVINRGTIIGSVSLGDNDDRFVLFASGNLPAVDGGAGTDGFALDGAAGTAGVFDLARAATLSGFEIFAKQGLGRWTLTGTAPAGLPGTISVEAGDLIVDADLGSIGATVLGGGTLGGSGRLGATGVANGGILSPGGDAIGTLSLASLTLAPSAQLRFDLGRPDRIGGSDNDLIIVAGDLTLDGILNVVDRPDFGEGVYRLIDYGGALTDNGLIVATTPGGFGSQVQTVIAGQVNLVVGEALQFWDGTDTAADLAVDGGSGSWNASTPNWTRRAGDVNEAWGSGFGVFQGSAGTVSIAAEGVAATGLQFAVDGYRIEGGALILSDPALIRVGDGSAAGAAYSATIAAPVGGTGGVTKSDLGTLILSGANTYAGGTTIAGGILSVAGDGNLGAPSGGVTLDGGTLRLTGALTSARGFTIGAAGGTLDTGANAATLSGSLAGAGRFTRIGSGLLTYGGDGSGFAGRFDLAGGAMRLDGRIGGTLAVAAGARLSGTGTLGDLIVAGTLAPGNSIGTLRATGNASFLAGSTFEVEVSGCACDRLEVGGSAALGGGTVRILAIDPATSYVNGTRYTFLTAAGGVTGNFAGITDDSAFLDFSLGQTATSVFATVNVMRAFPDVAVSFNQAQAAAGLMQLDQTSGSDALAVYNSLLLLDADEARAAFDIVSGEIYASAAAASRREAQDHADRLIARANTVAGEGWGLWGGVDGLNGRVDRDGNGAKTRSDRFGGEMGVDYRGAGWAAGIGGGWGKGDITSADRGSHVDRDGWHVGGFARYGSAAAGLTVNASLAYARDDATLSRAMPLTLLGTAAGGDCPDVIRTETIRSAGARLDIESIAAAAEVRYGFAAGDRLSVGPSLRIGYAKSRLDGFAETGAGSLALSGNGPRDGRLTAAAGGFLRVAAPGARFDLSAHYVTGERDFAAATLRFAGSPQAFTVRSADPGRNAVAIAAAGEADLGSGWSIGGRLVSGLSAERRSIAGSGTIAFRF